MARHTISIDELDGFEVEDDGRLYWRGKGVILERRLRLNLFQNLVALTAAVGAFLAGLHPFGVTFGWW